MSWNPYRIIDCWVDGFDIYCKRSDGTWKLDIRDYSQAHYPRVQYLINNPDVLAKVGFDEDGFPEWPNGWAPDPDVFKDEGMKVNVEAPNKSASSLAEPTPEEALNWLRTLGIEYKMINGKPHVRVEDEEKILSILERKG